jgi:hypothetical protein
MNDDNAVDDFHERNGLQATRVTPSNFRLTFTNLLKRQNVPDAEIKEILDRYEAEVFGAKNEGQ